jgi:Domain of unknown function (DUF4276)
MRSTLVFCLEELSARALLETLMPRLIHPERALEVEYITFKGKQHLHKNLLNKMSSWHKPNSFFIVLQDQDSNDCKILKQKLDQLCKQSGKSYSIRIACHELESYFLGDLAAVAKAFDMPSLEKQQTQSKYRNPDALGNAYQELEKITKKRYRKMPGARAIAHHLNLAPTHNTSKSFHHLLRSIRGAIETQCAD